MGQKINIQKFIFTGIYEQHTCGNINKNKICISIKKYEILEEKYKKFELIY